MSSHLPDPALGEAARECQRCAYSLEGVGDQGRCPECGLPFHPAEHILVIHGTAKSQESAAWRRVVWILLITSWLFVPQLLVILAFRRPVIALVIALTMTTAVVAMILTGRGRSRGTERFILSPAGLGRAPAGSSNRAEFSPWDGPIRTELKRVGSMWSKLKIVGLRDGRHTVHLDAGIRCRDQDRELVEQTLAHIRAANAPQPLAAPVTGTAHDHPHA